MTYLLLILVVALGSGCICSQPTETAPAPTSTQGPPQTVASEVAEKIMVTSTPELGSFLVDANGMTLYAFGDDEPGKSNCYGDCATQWPPLNTPDNVFTGVGLEGVIGYVSRTDGPSQVTYDGAPLYYYVQDKSPGDVKGEGVGGVWHVAATSEQEATSTTVGEETNAESVAESITSDESGIKFTTDPDRDTYSLKDTFGPKVGIGPLNPQHNYIIVIYMHAEGASTDGGTDTQSMTGSQSTDIWLHPFTNDESGYSIESEHFTTPGVHRFEISVYDCTAIEASTGVENCARGKKIGVMEKWEFPDALKSQEPDAKIDKAITVVG